MFHLDNQKQHELACHADNLQALLSLILEEVILKNNLTWIVEYFLSHFERNTWMNDRILLLFPGIPSKSHVHSLAYIHQCITSEVEKIE